MDSKISDAILDFLKREHLDPGDQREIGAGTPLLSSGIVDSFAIVSLTRFLEQEFGIRIPDADATAETFDTVERMAALVARLRNPKATL